MSLYICSACGHIENTALSRWHMGSSRCAGCDEFAGHKPGLPAVTTARRKPPATPEPGDSLLVRDHDDGPIRRVDY